MSDVIDAYADSFPAQLASLKRGESLSKVKRLRLKGLTVEKLHSTKRDLRSSVSTAIARAQKRADGGAKFVAETGDFRTETDDIIVCLVITREA
jgi:hypothetical protein